MGMDLLETNLTGLTDAEYILRMNTIAEKLEAHPAFPEFPEYVPGPARLRELTEQFQKAMEAAKGGDRDRKAEKKALREEGQLAQSITAAHVVIIYHHRKDQNVLLNTGWELKHRAPYARSAGKASLPPLPEKFLVKHGPESGTVVITVSKPQGSASMELWVTTEDPSVESAWKEVGIYRKCRVEVKGLEPAKRHYFRMRYRNDDIVGQWSQPVAIIVI